MPRNLPCPRLCSTKLYRSKARRRHVHREHGPVEDVCLLCTEPFLSTQALKRHTSMAHNNVAQMSDISLREASLTDELYGNTDLDECISTLIQPDEQFLKTEQAAVDSLVRLLQQDIPAKIRPARVLKAGSLGKGTAVKGKSDIDLTLVMDKEAFPTVDSLKEGMEDLLSTLKTSLTHQQSKRDVIVEWDKTTKHSVQVTLTDNDGLRHSIDMLPAVDLKLDDAESVRNIFKQMEQSDSETKAFYSASLAPLQVELVRALPTKVKSLIRLIKFWNKEKVKPVLKDLCPTSYVYEVIIMDAWAKAKRPSNFDMKRAAHAVMTKLRNYKNMRICTPGIALYKRKSDKKRNKTAFIMDPCNPTNDIYNNRQFNWKGMSAEAKKWLNKPVFAGVSKTSKSW